MFEVLNIMVYLILKHVRSYFIIFTVRNLTNQLIFIILFSAGIISLLEEPMPELKVFALRKLDMIVDEFWPEISEAIEKMYVIYIP